MLRQAVLLPSYDASLEDIIAHLQVHYYEALTALQAQAMAYLRLLQSAGTHPFHSFSIACEDTLGKVGLTIDFFSRRVLPYTKELDEKAQSGHDCTHCSGGCDMGHKALLMELHQGHGELRRAMYELYTTALPLYSNLEYPEVYKSLRKELHVMDTALHHLIYLEESWLMPKLLESQKKIHAYTF